MPPNENSARMQSLWIGDRLSTMERLSIGSFLHHGHAFDLYVYDKVENVPNGTTVRDANAILPRSQIFTYQENGSFAGFANHFRYKLLVERGGWWVDLDTVCLRAFEFTDECVIASEPSHDTEVPTNAILKAAPGSPLLEFALRVCESKDPTLLEWGETGPRLIADAVARLGLERCVASAITFCPISYRDWELALLPGGEMSLDSSWSVHLWNEMWRRGGKAKDAIYPADCLFEKLKSRYLSQ